MAFQARQIGKYVIYNQIARGGMAEVFHGKTIGAAGFEKRVALKRILPDFSASEDFQKMFLSEARIMASLVHPNIVQVTDFFRDDGDLYLVMEYVFGRNLRQLLSRLQPKGIQVSVPMALYTIIEAARGLDYAHRRADEQTGTPLGIIHRDVSPQNIMITFDGGVKVLDFGIVKFLSKAEKTETGILKGKFGYMSPEQVEALPLDYRSDIFSLGVNLFEMLAGRKLFQADTEVQFVKMIESYELPRTGAIRPEVNESLEAVLNKALQKDRALRYQSAHDLSEDLARILYEDYGGFNALKAAEYLKAIFADEYEAELKIINQTIDFDVISVDEASIGKSARDTLGKRTQTHVRRVETETRVSKNPVPANNGGEDQNWYEFKDKLGIRYKVALDLGVPWHKPKLGDAPSISKKDKKTVAPKKDAIREETKPTKREGAGAKGVSGGAAGGDAAADAAAAKPGSKSLFKKIWQDPKKRRLLIIGGLIFVLLLILLSQAPEEEDVNGVPPPSPPEQTEETTP